MERFTRNILTGGLAAGKPTIISSVVSIGVMVSLAIKGAQIGRAAISSMMTVGEDRFAVYTAVGTLDTVTTQIPTARRRGITTTVTNSTTTVVAEVSIDAIFRAAP